MQKSRGGGGKDEKITSSLLPLVAWQAIKGAYKVARAGLSCKGTLLGTPSREPQEYSRNIMEYKDLGRYIPIIYLLYSWGSQ